MTSREFQHRLLLAIAGAVGCHGQPTARQDTEARDAVTGGPTQTEIASPPSTPNVPPVASTVAPKPTALCGGAPTRELCFAPRTNARSTGTGEPAPPPPPSAYNAQGCLPKDLVSNGCCVAPVAGPQFKGGNCCYTFCSDGPCCGRPFVIRGQARLARVRRSTEWAPFAAEPSLDARTRDAIAAAWLDDARMEHASAAAFGRFVVQLVGLGAPPALITDAARAAADEVKHAESCFALAARMHGFASGPMPMSIDGALDAQTLEAVIAEVIVEGCFGETVAALIASEMLEAATDSETRRALARISEDEARHAELAWRFVRWALDTGGDAARATARRTFDTVTRGRSLSRQMRGDIDVDAWRAHGRLLPSERDATAARAVAEVVMPCANVLLG